MPSIVAVALIQSFSPLVTNVSIISSYSSESKRTAMSWSVVLSNGSGALVADPAGAAGAGREQRDEADQDEADHDEEGNHGTRSPRREARHRPRRHARDCRGDPAASDQGKCAILSELT